MAMSTAYHVQLDLTADNHRGIGNGIMLGYLMYRSELVPPRMAMVGLIGGSSLILNHLLILGGAYANGESFSGLLTLPEAAWERTAAGGTSFENFEDPGADGWPTGRGGVRTIGP